MRVIRLENISKSFDGGRGFVVRGVSLEVARGECVAVVGMSGSGKTTTLRMINRLVEPTEGRVFVNGEDVLGVDAISLRRGIGYVFQGVGLFPHWTVARNVGVVLRLLGWERGRVRARVGELLELVGLPESAFGGRLPRELSGGQRQRVGVARALAGEPDVLLMDEPFGALDAVTRDQLQGEVERIRARTGVSVLLVTHDLSEAVRLGDRVGVMREGRLVQVGTPGEVVRGPVDEGVAELVGMPMRAARGMVGLADGVKTDGGAA